MNKRLINKTLKTYISGFTHEDWNDTKVLTRMEVDWGNRSHRTYWTHGGRDPIPTDAEVVGTVAEIREYFNATRE